MGRKTRQSYGKKHDKAMGRKTRQSYGKKHDKVIAGSMARSWKATWPHHENESCQSK